MAEDLDLAPAAESGGADAEVSRAEASLERAAERSGLAPAPDTDRGSEGPPAAETTPTQPAPPTPPAWEKRWEEGNRTWTGTDRQWRQRREESRRAAAERRAQEALDEKLAKLETAIGGLAEGKGGGEEPDFDLDQKAWFQAQLQGLRQAFEEQLIPLKETLTERQERLQEEAQQREQEENFGQWAAERAEWVREAEEVWVGGDRQRAAEYSFYKKVVAETCYDQGRMIFGDGPQAQAFARSAMLAMTDMAERYGKNPAALVEGLGRQQMMTALRMAQSLGIIEMVKGNGATKAPAASMVSDQKEFIQSAEAGGAAPPPAARQTGKAPREGDFTRWAVSTLTQKGGKSGMPEVMRRGREKYGSDWPRVYADLQQTIRQMARG